MQASPTPGTSAATFLKIYPEIIQAKFRLALEAR